jgi:hypothetical protein
VRRFAPTAQGPGAVGTPKASGTIVGPQCGLGVELYGTDGSWHKVPPVPGASFGREPAPAPGSGRD